MLADIYYWFYVEGAQSIEFIVKKRMTMIEQPFTLSESTPLMPIDQISMASYLMRLQE